MSILRWLDKNLEEFLMVAFLVIMASIMGVQVTMRYVFNNSLVWSEELTRYLFIWSAFISVSYCVKNQSSIKIDNLYNAVPKTVQKLFAVISKTAMLLFFLYVFKFSLEVVSSTYLSHQKSPAMGLPIYIVQMSTVVGFFLCIIRQIQNLFQTLKPSKLNIEK
jgi:TRAP-type C4-dicarboxylate transport system permease small subunit